MRNKTSLVVVALAVITAMSLPSRYVHAQSAEVKERPPMYTYYGTWDIPRAKWADMEKSTAADLKPVDQAFNAGQLLGHGDDTNIVHTEGGATHDNWWSAMSLAAVLDVLDSLTKIGTGQVLTSATHHADQIFLSRYYNWRGGSYKGAYTHTAYYKLKPGAPDDAIDTMSKTFIVPMMEKLLADGTIIEYEVDEEAIHTESPDAFWVDYMCPTSACLDKVSAALVNGFKSSPLTGPAFSAMTDDSAHRDFLQRSNATYK